LTTAINLRTRISLAPAGGTLRVSVAPGHWWDGATQHAGTAVMKFVSLQLRRANGCRSVGWFMRCW